MLPEGEAYLSLGDLEGTSLHPSLRGRAGLLTPGVSPMQLASSIAREYMRVILRHKIGSNSSQHPQQTHIQPKLSFFIQGQVQMILKCSLGSTLIWGAHLEKCPCIWKPLSPPASGKQTSIIHTSLFYKDRVYLFLPQDRVNS